MCCRQHTIKAGEGNHEVMHTIITGVINASCGLLVECHNVVAIAGIRFLTTGDVVESWSKTAGACWALYHFICGAGWDHIRDFISEQFPVADLTELTTAVGERSTVILYARGVFVEYWEMYKRELRAKCRIHKSQTGKIASHAFGLVMDSVQLTALDIQYEETLNGQPHVFDEPIDLGSRLRNGIAHGRYEYIPQPQNPPGQGQHARIRFSDPNEGGVQRDVTVSIAALISLIDSSHQVFKENVIIHRL